jgi:AcrR family transcriptional regulator
MPPATVPRRARREVCPEQLTAAALELFLARGFAATRIEDVARRAGVSKGAIYLYFPTKEALFHAVVREGVVARVEEAEATAAAHSGSARDVLDALMHGVLLDFWGSPSSGIPKLIMAEAQAFPELARDYFESVTLRSRELVEGILKRGVDEGEFRAMDIHNTARAILAALEHQPVLYHSLGAHDPRPLEPRPFVDAMLDLVSHGLLREPAADSGA